MQYRSSAGMGVRCARMCIITSALSVLEAYPAVTSMYHCMYNCCILGNGGQCRSGQRCFSQCPHINWIWSLCITGVYGCLLGLRRISLVQ
ncbi:hypothetical protein EV127DRAFT_443224 [Xylaria flabelliformis]|nr:hypothetical protein EV127DRAFT_443224 [Xylaria flabelliformis]